VLCLVEAPWSPSSLTRWLRDASSGLGDEWVLPLIDGTEPDPRIIVLGDMNDGSGREYFEREYLHHDLIGNLQGDVFFATRFLNHALFDYEDHLRWSTEFNDKVETWSQTLPDARIGHGLYIVPRINRVRGSARSQGVNACLDDGRTGLIR